MNEALKCLVVRHLPCLPFPPFSDNNVLEYESIMDSSMSITIKCQKNKNQIKMKTSEQ